MSPIARPAAGLFAEPRPVEVALRLQARVVDGHPRGGQGKMSVAAIVLPPGGVFQVVGQKRRPDEIVGFARRSLVSRLRHGGGPLCGREVAPTDEQQRENLFLLIGIELVERSAAAEEAK